MNNQKGQSTVEYILLFAVVASISFTIFNGLGFNRFFGPNGTVATSYRNQLEFSYRHAFGKIEPGIEPNYNSGNHESYSGQRFFSASEGYPNN